MAHFIFTAELHSVDDHESKGAAQDIASDLGELHVEVDLTNPLDAYPHIRTALAHWVGDAPITGELRQGRNPVGLYWVEK